VVAFCSPLFWVDLRPGRVESRTLQVLARAGQVRISERGAQLRLQLHQQVSAPWGPFLTLTPGRSCPPGVNFVPSGRSYPLGVKFSVRPSILLNSRECSRLGVKVGVNIPPRGQILTLGARGEVKNGPLTPALETNLCFRTGKAWPKLVHLVFEILFYTVRKRFILDRDLPLSRVLKSISKSELASCKDVGVFFTSACSQLAS
jgi:hypothetical protein